MKTLLILASVFLLFISCSGKHRIIEIPLDESISMKLNHVSKQNFELTLTNIRNVDIIVPFFNYALYEKYGNWGGFSFNARPKNEKVWIYYNFNRFTNPQLDEFIVLKPGESYISSFDLGGLTRSDYADSDQLHAYYFRDAEGEYLVDVTFALIKDSGFHYPREIRHRLYGVIYATAERGVNYQPESADENR